MVVSDGGECQRKNRNMWYMNLQQKKNVKGERWKIHTNTKSVNKWMRVKRDMRNMQKHF